MDQEAEVSLLQSMILLQSVVLSCSDHKSFPFTRAQRGVFTVLAMEGELTMKQAARYLASSQEQATRAVAPLADAGYVERRTDPANRTRVYIRLTEAGRQLLQAYWTVLKQNLSGKLEDSLTGEERTSLYEASGVIIRLMEKVRLKDEKIQKTGKQNGKTSV